MKLIYLDEVRQAVICEIRGHVVIQKYLPMPTITNTRDLGSTIKRINKMTKAALHMHQTDQLQ